MGRMDGKVVLVTGGSRGIGRGCVEMLAREGAKVGFTGRTEETGRMVEDIVKKAGGEAMFMPADSGSEADLARVVKATAEKFGRLTGLVNNAISQAAISTGKDSHVHEADTENFDEIMRVAVMGTVWGSKYAIPYMRQHGSGSIVNISASSSKSALPHRPAYHASKGAINALTRQMAVDYGKDDIRVNAIITGFILNGSKSMASIIEDPAKRAAFQKNIMVPRFGEPADIAAGVTYLLSDESKYVTGIELPIEGGALCHQALPELDLKGMAKLKNA